MNNFRQMLQPVFQIIAATEVDQVLEARLNEEFHADGILFKEIEEACHAGIAAGWMCAQGNEGRRFGRVIEPSKASNNLSVDVVQLHSIAGPHHIHPTGEICMIMPQDEEATFDYHSVGWCVYPPDTGHYPTVRGGTALILYMLPDGQIEFTDK